MFYKLSRKAFPRNSNSKNETEIAEAADSTNRKAHGKRYLGLGHAPGRTSRP